jgi:alpha-L-fucosidase
MNRRCEDFVANFTASAFDAGKWVSLFEKARAKHFVVVTVRLVQTFTSLGHLISVLMICHGHRNTTTASRSSTRATHRSVHFGPKCDLIAELLDTAKKQAPSFTV